MRADFGLIPLRGLAVAAVLATGIGCAAPFAATHASMQPTSSEALPSAEAPSPTPRAGYSTLQATSGNASKDETVYIHADASGTPQSTHVHAWLKNTARAQSLYDRAELSGIEVTEGDYAHTPAEQGGIAWQANGDDVHYEGDTNKLAPVQVKISYMLDGEPIDPAQLAGESGHVSIRFDYENTSTSTQDVDGAAVKMNTPFVAMTGVILDSGKFRNVGTEHAHAIADDERIVVIGYAMPGMEENLDDLIDTELPDHLTITADVEDFSMDMTATIVTNDLFNDIDPDDLDLGDIDGSLDELKSGLRLLADGSQHLDDGVASLLAGTRTLERGAGALSKGAANLSSGAKSLSQGSADFASSLDQIVQGGNALAAGSSETLDGLASLDNTGSELSAGADKIAQGLADLTGHTYDKDRKEFEYRNSDAMRQGTRSAAEGAAALNTSIGKLAESADAMSGNAEDASALRQASNAFLQGLEQASANPESQAQEEFDAAVSELEILTADSSSTSEQIQAASERVVAAANDLAEASHVQGAAEASAQAASSYSEIDAGIASLADTIEDAQPQSEQLAQSLAEIKELAGALDDALGGPGKLSDSVAAYTQATDELTAASREVALGVSSYAQGVTQVHDGLSALDKGTQQLASGLQSAREGYGGLDESIASLSGGSSKIASGGRNLHAGASKLKSGVGTIKDSTAALAGGLNEASAALDKGIDEALGNNKIKLMKRMKASVLAAQGYDTFIGKSPLMSGSVKFIVETDPIEVED